MTLTQYFNWNELNEKKSRFRYYCDIQNNQNINTTTALKLSQNWMIQNTNTTMLNSERNKNITEVQKCTKNKQI